MKTTVQVPHLKPVTAETRLFDRLSFDCWVAIVCLWPMLGLYIDGWAHNADKTESFFTPWHAVFYSGLYAVATVLGIRTVRHHAAGYSWRKSIPDKYGISLLGVIVFAAFGLADLAWHEILGVEIGVEALLSPTHLGIALAGALIVCGPILSAASRRHAGSSTWAENLPIILGLAFLLSNVTFWTQFAHPLVRPLATPDYLYKGPGLVDPEERESFIQALGVASIVLQAAILTGVVLFAQSRWRLPFGAVTVVLLVNGALVVLLRQEFFLVGAPAIAGLMADSFIYYGNPSPRRLFSWLAFAFAVPVTYFSAYYLILLATDDIWWPSRLWVGSIVLAGVMGLMLSFAFLGTSSEKATHNN